MATASFVQRDTTTQGRWDLGSPYASADHYNVIGAGHIEGGWASVSASGNSFTTWTSSFPKFLYNPVTGSHWGGVWYSFSSFTLDIPITDGKTHRLAFYFLDGDNGGRSQTVQILNGDSGDAVLDTQTVSGFYATPVWLVWDCSGHVKVRVTVTAGGNCVMSGYFFYGTGQSVSGSTGLPVKAHFGADGLLGNPAVGRSGFVVDAVFGTDGLLWRRGNAGLSVNIKFGGTGTVLQKTDRLATIFVRGEDITRHVKLGIRRSMQLTGGSKATAEFTITSKHGGFRPEVGDEVVIYEGDTRFFAGFVDTTTETDWTGSAGYWEIVVQCVDYGAICDRRIIGRRFEVPWGGLASILMGQIAMLKLADLGVSYVSTPIDAYLGVQTFNWQTVTEAFNTIAAGAGASWRIDFYKNLYLVDPSNGYEAAPFGIADNDGNWAEMKVQHTARGRANRVGIRNSQDLSPLWTDTYQGDGVRIFFFPMAQLQFRPIVKVNGVAQIVTEYPNFSAPYDWYWFPADGRSIVQNLANPRLTSSDTIEITYPSPLSYVKWSQDDSDIAANGLWEAIEEVRDVPDIEAMGIIADSRVAIRKQIPTTVTFRTDKPGLEPGMALSINATRPPLTDSLLIQSLMSEEQGKKFFRHSVTASTAQLSDVGAAWQKVVAKGRQAKDRITEIIRVTLAETIEGIDNPGLSTGLKTVSVEAQKSGVLRNVTLYFPNGDTNPTDTPCEIDVLKNGVSIFRAGGIVWPAGATATQAQYVFETDPMPQSERDIYTFNVLQADPKAKDGILTITVLG